MVPASAHHGPVNGASAHHGPVNGESASHGPVNVASVSHGPVNGPSAHVTGVFLGPITSATPLQTVTHRDVHSDIQPSVSLSVCQPAPPPPSSLSLSFTLNNALYFFTHPQFTKD